MTEGIQNGVTNSGANPFYLDLSPTIDQFIKGQELEQERRRKVIQENENLLKNADLSRLHQTDLDAGIKQKYDAWKALGSQTDYKDFNKHDAELRSGYNALQNDINSAMNVRKTNMAMYDDLKSLLPPDELIKLQEDIKKPSINPDGTQNILSPSNYKLKPKDYLNVNKLVLDAIDQNTSKPENLKEVRRSDGKFNKLTGARINVENTLKYLSDSYNNDSKTRESIDNAVAQLNKLNPTGTPITAQEYIQNQVESNIVAKQSDRMKELYPDGIFKPGGKEAYININPITPNEWVSHVTVKTGDKSSDRALALYDKAHDELSRVVIGGKGDPENAAALATKIVKGAQIEGGTVSGITPYTDGSGQKGITVHYTDQYGIKFDPKTYVGVQALRQLGLMHNMKQRAVEAQVVPDPVPTEKPKENIKVNDWSNSVKKPVGEFNMADEAKGKQKKTKTIKFKGVPTGGF